MEIRVRHYSTSRLVYCNENETLQGLKIGFKPGKNMQEICRRYAVMHTNCGSLSLMIQKNRLPSLPNLTRQTKRHPLHKPNPSDLRCSPQGREQAKSKSSLNQLTCMRYRYHIIVSYLQYVLLFPSSSVHQSILPSRATLKYEGGSTKRLGISC